MRKAEAGYEGSKVFAHKVKAKDVLFAGDDINEFGYFPDLILRKSGSAQINLNRTVLGGGNAPQTH